MVQINDYDVKVSKGDTLSLAVIFEGSVPPEGTTVLFTVRANPEDKTAILQKDYALDEDGGILVHLTGKETNIEPGEYWWDLRIVMPGAVVVTPFLPAHFDIKEVVGDVW